MYLFDSILKKQDCRKMDNYETITELRYKVQLGEKLFIQPDLQHVFLNLGLFPD